MEKFFIIYYLKFPLHFVDQCYNYCVPLYRDQSSVITDSYLFHFYDFRSYLSYT